MAGQKNAHHLFALPFFAHIETYVEETNPAAKWCLLGYWHDFQSVPRKIDEFWFADINYPAGLHMTSTLDGCEEFRLKSNETSAPVAAAMENLVVDCSDFHLYCLRSVFESGSNAILLRRQLD
ncbi:MAG: hypothetical protein KDA91_23615 [Planctomycetaceae bacterium]|nr:hypothetical protein [Planctomycetaceae bacterium]